MREEDQNNLNINFKRPMKSKQKKSEKMKSI